MQRSRLTVLVTAALLATGCDKLLNRDDNKNEVTKSVQDNTVVGTTNLQAGAAPPNPGDDNGVTQKVPQAAVSKFSVGQKVRVLWKGTWYASTVLKVWPNERYSIHYDGWGSEWDEVVGLSRMKPR